MFWRRGDWHSERVEKKEPVSCKKKGDSFGLEGQRNDNPFARKRKKGRVG